MSLRLISRINPELSSSELYSYPMGGRQRTYFVNVKQQVARGLFSVLKRLHLRPIFAVIRELKRRGVDVSSLHALDLFAGTGSMITQDYEPFVSSLEAWEIEPSYERTLRKNLPRAQVRIVDSYKQLAITESRFGLVVADTWTERFGGHCEHFELFPIVFRVLDNEAILIVNVMPEWKVGHYNNEHLRRRRDFYQKEDVANMAIGSMVEVYESLARQNGYAIKWWFVKDRYLLYRLRRHAKKWRLCHLVLRLEKITDSANKS